jgi:hypothetical protein
VQIARITAVSRDKQPDSPAATFVIVCAIKDECIVDGEWHGHIKSEKVLYPFVYERGGRRLLYGWADNYRESTNLGKVKIRIGEYFYTEEAEGQGEPWRKILQIQTIHSY